MTACDRILPRADLEPLLFQPSCSSSAQRTRTYYVGQTYHGFFCGNNGVNHWDYLGQDDPYTDGNYIYDYDPANGPQPGWTLIPVTGHYLEWRPEWNSYRDQNGGVHVTSLAFDDGQAGVDSSLGSGGPIYSTQGSGWVNGLLQYANDANAWGASIGPVNVFSDIAHALGSNTADNPAPGNPNARPTAPKSGESPPTYGKIAITGNTPYGINLTALPGELSKSKNARIAWDLVNDPDAPYNIITAPATVDRKGNIAATGGTSGRTIWYDPNITRTLNDGTVLTPDWILAHELGHGTDNILGIVPSFYAGDSGTTIPIHRDPFGDPLSNPPYAPNDTEAFATRFANSVRDEILQANGKDIGHLEYYWKK